jgi:hypothetical protein
MNKIKNVKVSKKDRKIDEQVKRMAHIESEWEEPITVEPKTIPTSIRLNSRTIQRAKLFARIHHQRGYQSWIKKIVEERIETEYELYNKIRKETR